MKLLLGDCLDKLKELDDNSVDSIVTDPPYGLSFMGKKWDYDVPSQAIWEECLRVLKPGGHILSFAGSRTYHRMAVRIEDAGFEIRDQIMWIYGSGFPKSHNIGKAVDKIQGNASKIKGYVPRYPEGTRGEKKTGDSSWFGGDGYDTQPGMKPVYEINNEWEGWGTALKPAHEPIVMARKPLIGTVADNVLEYGVGGINIDGCRIGFRDEADKESAKPGSLNATGEHSMFGLKSGNELNDGGRFPANIILDEEAGKILDGQSGKLNKQAKCKTDNKSGWQNEYVGGTDVVAVERKLYLDEGGASRFFYCPKASKKDRESGNIHPTVKPTDLMAYLIRLVTPKGGVVLDPFMGSGSTGKAAVREGMEFIGIEREEEYYEIAKQRIENETNKRKFW
jgi:site-specific DNA-methyltransferase (adenine-specific)